MAESDFPPFFYTVISISIYYSYNQNFNEKDLLNYLMISHCIKISLSFSFESVITEATSY